MQRVDTIQALRFIAALLVLITHSGFYSHERLDSAFQYWPGGGGIGVNLFFVISGFVIMVSSEKLVGKANGWKIFMVRRLIRIVPNYWIATSLKVLALVLIPNQVLHYVLDSGKDWEYIIKSYFFIPSYNPTDGKVQPVLGVGWTLVFEMFFYLIFSITLAFKLNPLKATSVVLFVFFIGSFFKDRFLKITEHPVLFFLFDDVVVCFILGMIVAKFYQQEILMNNRLAVAAITFGLVSITLGFVMGASSTSIVAIASFLIVWGCVSIEKGTSFDVPKWLVFLGGASYSTYLFHPLIVPIVPMIFRKLDLIYPYAATVASILVAIAVTSVVYVAFERRLTKYLVARLPYSR